MEPNGKFSEERCVCMCKRVACVARGGRCSLGKPGAHCVLLLLLLLRPGSRPAVVTVLSRFCLGFVSVVSVLSRCCLGVVSVLSRFFLGVVLVLSRCCTGFVSVLSRCCLLWKHIVETHCGNILWTKIVETRCGNLLWKHTVETYFGNTL